MVINYLKNGNNKQRQAYESIMELNILEDLSEYQPVLCGTIPLGIDIDKSDLDFIMEVYQLNQFKNRIIELYGNETSFLLKDMIVRGRPVIKANFYYQGFEFELFGQPQPVKEQYAYLHMIIEKAILDNHPHLKEHIIKLKKEGLKTEPAFCKLLNIEGDPYDELIVYGKKNGFI
ncbi:DUF4269 domain-containing protein [Bacillaceae bacterium W0354]